MDPAPVPSNGDGEALWHYSREELLPLVETIGEKLQDEEIPLSHVQGHLLRYMTSPQDAVENVHEMLDAVRLDRELIEKHRSAMSAAPSAGDAADRAGVGRGGSAEQRRANGRGAAGDDAGERKSETAGDRREDFGCGAAVESAVSGDAMRA